MGGEGSSPPRPLQASAGPLAKASPVAPPPGIRLRPELGGGHATELPVSVSLAVWTPSPPSPSPPSATTYTQPTQASHLPRRAPTNVPVGAAIPRSILPPPPPGADGRCAVLRCRVAQESEDSARDPAFGFANVYVMGVPRPHRPGPAPVPESHVQWSRRACSRVLCCAQSTRYGIERATGRIRRAHDGVVFKIMTISSRLRTVIFVVVRVTSLSRPGENASESLQPRLE
jgi:hypothetical protein